MFTASNSEASVIPMFLSKLPPSQTLSDGDTLTLQCDVIGSPEPEVHWLRDGLDLPDTLTLSTQVQAHHFCLYVYLYTVYFKIYLH